jgi:hypothetical protein
VFFVRSRLARQAKPDHDQMIGLIKFGLDSNAFRSTCFASSSCQSLLSFSSRFICISDTFAVYCHVNQSVIVDSRFQSFARSSDQSDPIRLNGLGVFLLLCRCRSLSLLSFPLLRFGLKQFVVCTNKHERVILRGRERETNQLNCSHLSFPVVSLLSKLVDSCLLFKNVSFSVIALLFNSVHFPSPLLLGPFQCNGKRWTSWQLSSFSNRKR